MRQHSAWIIELVLKVLLPAQGRHRSTNQPPTTKRPDTPQERRLQRSRRRAVWLATVGVDAGPRWIHGVEVAG